jgi:hypothetical protein
VKRWTVIASLTALAVAASAQAAGPSGKQLPFHFAVPKSGHAAVYGIKVTVHIPANMTIPPVLAPLPQATNAKALAKGTTAGSVVVPDGKGVWDIFIGIDSRKASGSGASSLTGAVFLQGPLATMAASSAPIAGNVCAGAQKEAGGPNVQFWLIAGPDSGYKTVVTDAAKFCK